MKVSVVVITYNHERFILQALNSVIGQSTNFDFEIIVTEDCSTDHTRKIVQSFQADHSDRVRLLLSEKNQHNYEVLSRAIEAASGSYIALLDGDDYWNSNSKLQKQVDYLEAHPNCSICFHNGVVVYEDGSQIAHPFHQENPVERISAPKPKPLSTLEDLVTGNFMLTCSVMFRAGLFDGFPSWYRDFPVGDWPLHVMNAQHGDIGYIDETLCTYRVHSGGLWSSRMSLYNSYEDVHGIIRAYQTINNHLDHRFDRVIRGKLPYLHFRAAKLLLQTDRFSDARSHILKGLICAAPHFGRRERDAVLLGLKSLVKQARVRLQSPERRPHSRGSQSPLSDRDVETRTNVHVE